MERGLCCSHVAVVRPFWGTVPFQGTFGGPNTGLSRQPFRNNRERLQPHPLY